MLETEDRVGGDAELRPKFGLGEAFFLAEPPQRGGETLRGEFHFRAEGRFLLILIQEQAFEVELIKRGELAPNR